MKWACDEPDEVCLHCGAHGCTAALSEGNDETPATLTYFCDAECLDAMRPLSGIPPEGEPPMPKFLRQKLTIGEVQPIASVPPVPKTVPERIGAAFSTMAPGTTLLIQGSSLSTVRAAWREHMAKAQEQRTLTEDVIAELNGDATAPDLPVFRVDFDPAGKGIRIWRTA